jgi:hypothetical protein
MTETGRFGEVVETRTVPGLSAAVNLDGKDCGHPGCVIRHEDGEPTALISSGEHIPVATSKGDLKGPGTLATAVVVPKTGDLGVAPGTPVVTIAKHILDSPAVQKLLKVTYAAWGVFAAYVGFKIYQAGGVFGALDWTGVLQGGFSTAVASALTAYGIYAKATDPDPIVDLNPLGRPSSTIQP